MKNTCGYLAAILMFSLSAVALTPSIYLFSPGLRIGDKFNLGHVMRVGGYIGAGENINVKVKFYIDPGSNQIKITEFEHNFSTGESLLLSEYEDELSFQILNLSPGNHYVKMFIYDASLPASSQPIAEAYSFFSVTDELDLSSCNVDKSIVLIGENIIVSCPYILSSFGQASSYANISFGGSSTQISTPTGSFSQPIQFIGTKSDDKIFIRIWDSFGNNASKTIGFIVSNVIIIRANAEKAVVPGQDMALLVSLQNVRGDSTVGDINASMLINSTRIDRSQASVSSTTFHFPIPDPALPGSYYIKLDASDRYGNAAEPFFFTFTITRVAKALVTRINDNTFEVGDSIDFLVTVYDQENHTIQGKPVKAELHSESGLLQSWNLTTDSDGRAGADLEVTASMPAGAWELRYSADEAMATDSFLIELLNNLSIFLDVPNKSGDKINFQLTIWNNGNTDITSELNSSCNECLGMRTKTVSIARGHVRYENITWYYPISQRPGEYNISFCLSGTCSNVRTFEIGQTMSEDTGFFFLEIAGAFVALLVLIYIIYYVKQSRTSHL